MNNKLVCCCVFAAAGLTYGLSAGNKPAGSKAKSLNPPTVVIEASGKLVIMPCAAEEAKCTKGAERIPARGKTHDFAALRTSLTRLRSRYDKLVPLYLTPELGVPWGGVVAAYSAAARGADGKPLFPVIFFALAGK